MLTKRLKETKTTINRLKTEYLKNPVGIDIKSPRFSWNMVSEDKGARQTAYRILVSKTSQDLIDGIYTWDTKKMDSDLAIGIAYQGVKLEPSTRYYWKVTIWDHKGRSIDSNIAFFETGLMSSDGMTNWGGARWITKPGQEEVPAKSDRKLLKTYDISTNVRIINHSAGLIFSYSDNEFMLVRIEPSTIEGSLYQMGLYHGTPYGIEPYTYLEGEQYTDNRGLVRVQPVELSNFNPEIFHSIKICVREGSPVCNIPGRIEIFMDGGLTPILSTSVARYGGSLKGGSIGFYNPNSSAEYSSIKIEQPEIEKVNIFGPPTQLSYITLADFRLDGESETFVKIGSDVHAEVKILNQSITLTDEIVIEGPTPGAPMFRKDFRVSKQVKQARLYSTGGGVTEFYINGSMVGDDYFAPGYTDYSMTYAYQTYDVTALLNSMQDNTIGVMLGNGWYSGSEDVHYKPYGTQPKVMARLAVQYTDGAIENIVTDESWQYYGLGPITRNVTMDGVTHDARREEAIEGWSTASFLDEKWKKNASLLPAPSNDIYGVKVISDNASLPRQIDTLTPIGLTPNPADSTRTIIDFGQNMVGNIKLTLRGGIKGQVVCIRFAEMLNDVTGFRTGDGPKGTLYTENYRTAKSTDYFILSGKAEEVFSPRFTFHGFRYVEITGYPGKLQAEDILGIVISSATEETFFFECSNPEVNRLQRNIEWGMKGNFFSVPTDCPQRDERMGWTGDAQLFARTAVFSMDVQMFLKKWMVDLNDTLQKLGFYTGLYAPFNSEFANSFSGWWTAWSDVGIELPFQIWQVYGDTRLIEENFENLKTYMNYVSTRTIPQGYLIDPRPFVGVGDHVSLVPTSVQLVATAYYAYTAQLMYLMAKGISRYEDAAHFEQLYKKIKSAFCETFLQEDGTILLNEERAEFDTQTAYALALNFNLLPEDKISDASQRLVELGYDFHTDGSLAMTTGFLGTRDLCPALSKSGKHEAAYDLILNKSYPSWLYTVEQGATTMWERWNSYTLENGFGDVSMNSFNHYAFGAVGEWLYNYMLGIQTDSSSPGFKHFILQPTIDPKAGTSSDRITWAKGEFQSVHGLIKSHWSVEDNQITFRISVPANTTASVKLQGAFLNDILESGLPVLEVEGISSHQEVINGVVLEVIAGNYEFSYLRR
ncbi:family 78 glycoside hydrolase catalytic domain [Peribacillus sp. NPDC096379]|uniref:alpha-L-rhamnosidase n=1 Tax=Peribacillus sp. NPDC096379 TaxID=3364393 RepID=UPI00382A1AC6